MDIKLMFLVGLICIVVTEATLCNNCGALGLQTCSCRKRFIRPSSLDCCKSKNFLQKFAAPQTCQVETIGDCCACNDDFNKMTILQPRCGLCGLSCDSSSGSCGSCGSCGSRGGCGCGSRDSRGSCCPQYRICPKTGRFPCWCGCTESELAGKQATYYGNLPDNLQCDCDDVPKNHLTKLLSPLRRLKQTLRNNNGEQYNCAGELAEEMGNTKSDTYSDATQYPNRKLYPHFVKYNSDGARGNGAVYPNIDCEMNSCASHNGVYKTNKNTNQNSLEEMIQSSNHNTLARAELLNGDWVVADVYHLC